MRAQDAGEDMTAVDPVCGRRLRADDAAVVHHEYRDRPWHFCSEACRERFVRLAARIQVAEVARRGALFRAGQRITWGRA